MSRMIEELFEAESQVHDLREELKKIGNTLTNARLLIDDLRHDRDCLAEKLYGAIQGPDDSQPSTGDKFPF